jgi:hypothetical protein
MGESPTLALAKSCLALFASGKANPSASGRSIYVTPLTIYGTPPPDVVGSTAISSLVLGLYEKGASDSDFIGGSFGGAEGGDFPGNRS